MKITKKVTEHGRGIMSPERALTISRRSRGANVTFTLEGLTEPDLVALRTVAGRIGGSPAGPRGTFDRIDAAIATLPFPRPGKLSGEMAGSIMLPDRYDSR